MPNFKIGGAEKIIIEIVNSLNYDNYKAIVVLCKKEGELVSNLNNNIIVIDLNTRIRFSIPRIVNAIRKIKPATSSIEEEIRILETVGGRR